MMIINLKQQSILGTCAFFAALVLLMLTYSIYQWHNDWQRAHQGIYEQPILPTSAGADAFIAAIQSEHLFGKSFSKVGNVPTTNLGLRVTGIVKNISMQGDALSKAYISIAGQPSKIYQIGDNLPYGVKIYGITTYAVILENDGHLEKLLLPREKLEFKPNAEEGHL